MARHLEAVHGRRLSLSWLVSTDRQVGCRTLPAVEDHFDSAAGAEGDAGEHADFLFGDQVHAEALGYSGEQEDGFHHGEAGADANSGAAAEWKVGEARDGFVARAFGRPPLGIENFRVHPEAWIAVERPLENHDVGFRGQVVAACVERLYRL